MKTIALLLSLCLPFCFAEEPIAQIVTLEPAPKVFKFFSNNGHQEWTATAFAVSEHRLLTAAHTFGFTTRKGYGKHFILRDGRFEEVTIVSIDYGKDVCVLQNERSCASWYELAPDSKHGGVIAAEGFAGDARTSSVTTGNWKKSSKRLDTDGGIRSGMSGCPMTDSQGRVVGMGVNGDDQKTHAVTVETLKEFLK